MARRGKKIVTQITLFYVFCTVCLIASIIVAKKTYDHLFLSYMTYLWLQIIVINVNEHIPTFFQKGKNKILSKYKMAINIVLILFMLICAFLSIKYFEAYMLFTALSIFYFAFRESYVRRG